jgi:hypothetical protein
MIYCTFNIKAIFDVLGMGSTEYFKKCKLTGVTLA